MFDEPGQGIAALASHWDPSARKTAATYGHRQNMSADNNSEPTPPQPPRISPPAAQPGAGGPQFLPRPPGPIPWQSAPPGAGGPQLPPQQPMPSPWPPAQHGASGRTQEHVEPGWQSPIPVGSVRNRLDPIKPRDIAIVVGVIAAALIWVLWFFLHTDGPSYQAGLDSGASYGSGSTLKTACESAAESASKTGAKHQGGFVLATDLHKRSFVKGCVAGAGN